MALRIEKSGHPMRPDEYRIFSGRQPIGWIVGKVSPLDKTNTTWHWSLSSVRGVGHEMISPTLERAKLGVRMAWDEWLATTDLQETTPPPNVPVEAAVIEEEVDMVLSEFDGDARRAIAALLDDLGNLAFDAQSVVSKGYVRGLSFSPTLARRRALKR